MKSTPKKCKVRMEGPVKMKEVTWYRNWTKESINYNKRTLEKKKMIFAMKSEKKRCYTEALPELKL